MSDFSAFLYSLEGNSAFDWQGVGGRIASEGTLRVEEKIRSVGVWSGIGLQIMSRC